MSGIPYQNTDFDASDDSLHTPTGSFYDNETFWYSFFVPERRLGGWLYTGVRQLPGITHGGLWIWDDGGYLPSSCRFYEGFSHLKARHFDQVGHVVGTVELDGERVDVDCYAIRDRSWGPRTERGYRRVGYTWGGSAELSFLTFSAPSGMRTGSTPATCAATVRSTESAKASGGSSAVPMESPRPSKSTSWTKAAVAWLPVAPH